MANLKAKCPKTEWPLIKARVDGIYYAPNRMEPKAQADIFIQECRSVYPAFVDCLQKDLDASTAHNI